MVTLKAESWTWWSFVMFIWICRVISRRMTLGSFRKFQADDYLMALALSFYLAVIVVINIVRHTSSNLLPPGFDIDSLTPAEIDQRAYGSKLILVVEQCQCVTIWATKICLILLYLRITTVYRENLAVKILLGYVVVSFVVMDILYLGVWCQPFHDYWAVPTPNKQCDAATNHLITNAVFNLTSDIAMFLIILPMFLRMKLPWRKKIPLLAVFGLGTFTILCAVLNKWYSFTQPFGAEWTYWYVRESSTALLVANLPFVWTLWRKISGAGSINAHSQSQSGSRHDSFSPRGAVVETGTPSSADSHELKDRTRRMTFAEMLTDAHPADARDVNEFTHPALFYTRNRGESVPSKPQHQSHVEKAALGEELELGLQFQTVAPGAHDGTSSASPPLRRSVSGRRFV